MDRREALRLDLGRGERIMEALLTMSYLTVMLGLVGGLTYALDTLWQAHKRGMARVRAYDARQEAKR